MINKYIRSHLSKDVPKNDKDELSSKYLRTSSITKIAAQRGVDFFKIHAPSGQSLITNHEMYLDKSTLTLNFPGAYDLNGWVDATPKKLYPRFHCLGTYVI